MGVFRNRRSTVGSRVKISDDTREKNAHAVTEHYRPHLTGPGAPGESTRPQMYGLLEDFLTLGQLHSHGTTGPDHPLTFARGFPATDQEVDQTTSKLTT